MSLIEIRQEQVLAKKKRLHHAIDVSTTFVGSELSFTLLDQIGLIRQNCFRA
ncbi:hypothetical protein Plhal304r1_c001g0004401 [Plasmopara halstedii]